MSELIAPQQQIAAAINQLSQRSASNQLTSDSVDIVVRQITSTQILLTNGNREIAIPRQQLTGNLRPGQTYQVAVTQETNSQPARENNVSAEQTLRFFSRSNLNLDIPLNRNQSQTFISNLSNITQRQVANAAQIISGRILQTAPNLLTVELNGLSTQSAPTSVTVPNRLALPIPSNQQGFALNQPIQLRLISESNNLTVEVSVGRSVQRIPLSSLAPIERPEILISPTAIISRFVQRPITSSLQDIVPALRDAIAQTSLNDNRTTGSKDKRQAGRTSNSSAQSNLGQTINARLSFANNGISVSTNAETEQAVFEQVTPQQSRQLRALSIPLQERNGNGLTNTNTSIQPSNASDVTTPGIVENLVTEPSLVNETPSEAYLRQVISSGSRQTVLTELQALIRQTRPLTESPSATLSRIEATLSDPDITASPEIIQLANRIKSELSQALPGNNSESSEAVRQLLSSAPSNTISTLTTGPTTSNNTLINGLISLLQITLASRLNNTNTQTTERLTQALSPILAPNVTSRNARQKVSRGLNEISQLDQKHLLLRDLSKFFAGHQNYKLSSIEQQLNSQEGFYYVLPSAQGEHRKDTELLIKRQHDNESEGKPQTAQSRAWQVSMKLDIGDKGQLLAKATLNEKEVEVDFYASSEELKSLVFDFIPALQDRLTAFGVKMVKHQCQLGKIPESLQKRPYQILETRV